MPDELLPVKTPLTKLLAMLALRVVLGLTAIAVPVLGATYSISDSYQGSDFLNGFHHQAISDPTHGRVYVTRASSPFRFLPHAFCLVTCRSRVR